MTINIHNYLRHNHIMFSSNTLITGGTFTHVQGTTIGGFERLQQAVASSAFHNSRDVFDPPKCHPNTRTAVIGKIMSWIYGLWEEHSDAVILWFYGPAGAGKSAIARNIAERCDIEKILLATFFFSRSDPTRSDPKSLIATIAYQITTNLPQTRGKMIASIDRDPLVLTRSFEAQVEALIVEPLRELLDAGYFTTPSSRRLIIIDGLDECHIPAVQCKVLDAISLLFQKYHLPFLILVASRPERHLIHSFNTGSLHEFHTTLALDDTYQPYDDIRLFLADNFKLIKDTHPLKKDLNPSWPSIDLLERLVRKSSGHFIYASTIVKYVSSIRHQPAPRLDVVLGIRPPRHARDMPFGELDRLYQHILSAVEDIETVLLIIGFRLIRPASSMTLQDLEHFFLLDTGETVTLFGDLNSVIDMSDVAPCIHILHASLGDFLLDEARSQKFYIDPSKIHTTCMHLCFQHNQQYLTSNHRDDSWHFWYAGDHLMWHCENALTSGSARLREDISNFPLDSPRSCFAGVEPRACLYFLIPRFLRFIKTLPFEDADEMYNRNLGLVLDFFTSKLQLYYSSSRLTLLLTSLYMSLDSLGTTDHFYGVDAIFPLPPRLKAVDTDTLSLHNVLDFYNLRLGESGQLWQIFLDFLGSGDPFALDGGRYATAAWACLNIIFKSYQHPVFLFTQFAKHSRAMGLDLEHLSKCYLLEYPEEISGKVDLYWHFRTTLPRRLRWEIQELRSGRHYRHDQFRAKRIRNFEEEFLLQNLRSNHLQFLLEKSAYSNNLLSFARRRVFRFRYLHRKHPAYMKKAIVALAKYIQRVTGSTAEVRDCESIWGRNRWFTAP